MPTSRAERDAMSTRAWLDAMADLHGLAGSAKELAAKPISAVGIDSLMDGQTFEPSVHVDGESRYITQDGTVSFHSADGRVYSNGSVRDRLGYGVHNEFMRGGRPVSQDDPMQAFAETLKMTPLQIECAEAIIERTGEKGARYYRTA